MLIHLRFSFFLSEFEDAIWEVLGVQTAKLKGLIENVHFDLVLLFVSEVGPEHAEVKAVEEEANDGQVSLGDLRFDGISLSCLRKCNGLGA